MDEQEQQKEEVSQEEVQSEEQVVEDAVEQVEEEVKQERPAKNYEAELARKNAEIERLRKMADNKPEVKRHDPTDLNTWEDLELKAIMHSNDPQALPLKAKAEDILMDRKINAKLERRLVEGKNKVAEVKLKKDYPEAMDSSSEFALKMEEVMQEYDLSQSPAGRLAAAKIVASELKSGASNASAKGRNAEQARIARVKGNMVDGDRPKSAQNKDTKQKEQAINKLNDKNLNTQAAGMSDILKSRGLTRDSFFKR